MMINVAPLDYERYGLFVSPLQNATVNHGAEFSRRAVEPVDAPQVDVKRFGHSDVGTSESSPSSDQEFPRNIAGHRPTSISVALQGMITEPPLPDTEEYPLGRAAARYLIQFYGLREDVPEIHFRISG